MWTSGAVAVSDGLLFQSPCSEDFSGLIHLDGLLIQVAD